MTQKGRDLAIAWNKHEPVLYNVHMHVAAILYMPFSVYLSACLSELGYKGCLSKFESI
jgi:hypothetical protein